jgi:hypothetical protein
MPHRVRIGVAGLLLGASCGSVVGQTNVQAWSVFLDGTGWGLASTVSHMDEHAGGAKLMLRCRPGQEDIEILLADGIPARHITLRGVPPARFARPELEARAEDEDGVLVLRFKDGDAQDALSLMALSDYTVVGSGGDAYRFRTMGAYMVIAMLVRHCG